MILRLGNYLYKYCYSLYKPLYFFYKSISDKNKVEIIRKFIKPGMRALDIGANIGFYSILFSRLVGGDGEVYSYEPEEHNYSNLNKNTKSLKNIKTFNYAVGEIDEQIKLYHSDSLNVDHQTFDSEDGRKSTPIDCVSIDRQFGDDQEINVVKIDIQGYDFFALRGMKETLKRSNPVLIIGEFWPYGLVKAGVRPSEYIEYIKGLGFTVNFFDQDKEIYKNAEEDKKIYYDFYAIKGLSKNNLSISHSSSRHLCLKKCSK